PGDVVAGKVVQCFEKKPIVATLVAAPRQGSSKHLQCHRPIRFRHHRGHRRPPNQSAAHESDKVTLGNPQTDTCGNPSTPPSLRWAEKSARRCRKTSTRLRRETMSTLAI